MAAYDNRTVLANWIVPNSQHHWIWLVIGSGSTVDHIEILVGIDFKPITITIFQAMPLRPLLRTLLPGDLSD